MTRFLRTISAFALISLAAGCATTRAARGPSRPGPSLDAARAIVAAPDRSADDRALDGGRHPAELLAFAGVGPGMRVADLQAGGGYTTELLARAVGPTGRLFGQNSPFVLKRFAEKPWTERLAKPVMSGVVRVDRDLEDPLPPEATGLDVVTMVLFYHDAVWQKVDRARMNAAIFRALRPGGAFIVVDHSGRPGTGATETETFHRIEESVVKDELSRAGFRLATEADFLRNPADTRDWNDSPRVAGDRRGTSDRFVLKFVKP
ncbi:MAG TPA: SAM-dependent methyltransferase [Polyangia bacterium]|jgi:predicted methyltransferase|nr:SAM-dependent methyltransferase [Polyangia bacterium]